MSTVQVSKVFTTNTSGTWSAEVPPGSTWNPIPGAAQVFSEDGSLRRGKITTDAASATSVQAMIKNQDMPAIADFYVLGRVQPSIVQSGGQKKIGFGGRATAVPNDKADGYFLRYDFLGDGTATVHIRTERSNQIMASSTTSSFAVSDGDWWWGMMSVSGAPAQLKFMHWKHGTMPPTSFEITITDPN